MLRKGDTMAVKGAKESQHEGLTPRMNDRFLRKSRCEAHTCDIVGDDDSIRRSGDDRYIAKRGGHAGRDAGGIHHLARVEEVELGRLPRTAVDKVHGLQAGKRRNADIGPDAAKTAADCTHGRSRVHQRDGLVHARLHEALRQEGDGERRCRAATG